MFARKVDSSLWRRDMFHVFQYIARGQMAECAGTEWVGEPVVGPSSNQVLRRLWEHERQLINTGADRVAQGKPAGGLVPADIGGQNWRFAEGSVPGLLERTV